MEKGEIEKSALVRLMKEEVSSTLTSSKFLGKSYSPSGRSLSWYECSTNTLEIYPGSDLEDAKWVDKKDVLKELPDKTREIVPLSIKKLKKYQEAEKNQIIQLPMRSSHNYL
jgi:NADH pyrophosphatase NudC (nudix superfamily)